MPRLHRTDIDGSTGKFKNRRKRAQWRDKAEAKYREKDRERSRKR